MRRSLNNRVKFFSEETTGPEAHGSDYTELYECYCEDYEPSTKDYTVLNAPAGKKTVTIIIRDNYKEFKPEYNHSFELQSGYFNGVKFNIVNISPDAKETPHIKIVGEA